MKKIFLSLVAMMVSTVSFAQSSLLATLSHEGTIKTYYGAAALKNAHEDAVHGDVITLSSGSFFAVDITKAITLRGSGMLLDAEANREPTVITGDFSLNIPEDVEQRLTIEGIYSNHKVTYKSVRNPMFLKSRFLNFHSGDNASIIQNAIFVHCKFAAGLYINSNCSASFVNCIITNPNTHTDGTGAIEMTNCIVSSRMLGLMNSATFKNCYIEGTHPSNTNNTINTSCVLYNNVVFEPNHSTNKIISECPNNTNQAISSYDSLFKTYQGGWNDTETYELTEEAAAKYLGNDGTQIGIYGGNLPFDSTPSNPQITKCNVAAKSTADGKLSVDITIKAAE